MKQQDLKDIKGIISFMMKDISDKYYDPKNPSVDEDAEVISGALANVVTQLTNRIELKYKDKKWNSDE